MTTVQFVKASQRQHTPAGRLLGRMYYGGFLSAVLGRDEYSGYPHNGGEHTLRLKLAPADVSAFLELVKEHFQQYPEAVDAFVQDVLLNMRTRAY